MPPVKKFFIQGHSSAPTNNSTFPVPEGVFIVTLRMCGRFSYSLPIQIQTQIRNMILNGKSADNINNELSKSFQVYSSRSRTNRLKYIPNVSIELRKSNKRPMGVFNINKYNLVSTILGSTQANYTGNATGWGHVSLLNAKMSELPTTPGIFQNSYYMDLPYMVHTIKNAYPNNINVIFVNMCQSQAGGFEIKISNRVNRGLRPLKIYKNNSTHYINGLYVNQTNKIVNGSGRVMTNSELQPKLQQYLQQRGLPTMNQTVLQTAIRQMKQIVRTKSAQKSETNMRRNERPAPMMVNSGARGSRNEPINWNSIRGATRTNNLYRRMAKEMRQWSDNNIFQYFSVGYLGQAKYYELYRYLQRSTSQPNRKFLRRVNRLFS
jgi:hypothetical protein